MSTLDLVRTESFDDSGPAVTRNDLFGEVLLGGPIASRRGG